METTIDLNKITVGTILPYWTIGVMTNTSSSDKNFIETADELGKALVQSNPNLNRHELIEFDGKPAVIFIDDVLPISFKPIKNY